MTTLTKCKDCDEQIDVNEYDCEYCEDCCHENQMSWQTTDEGEGKDFGYFVEDEMLICSFCASNPLYYGLLTLAEAEGYPDGFTCADCGDVVKGGGE